MSTEFNQLLRQLMHARKVSQYKLGIWSNLGDQAICNILRGRRRANERHVLRLAIPLLMEPWQIEAMNELLEAAEEYIFPMKEDASRDGDAG